MKNRNKFGTSGDLSWHPQNRQGERARTDKGGCLQNPDGSDAIRGAGRLNLKMEPDSRGAFTPRVDAPRTPRQRDGDCGPVRPNWTPSDGKRGTRLDTGKTGGEGKVFPALRRPDRGE